MRKPQNGIEKCIKMTEGYRPFPRALKAVALRALLPVLTGPLLFIVSLFYNISAKQGGVHLQLSGVKLLINTLSTARGALTAGEIGGGERTYYILMTVGALVAIFCFAAALFFALWGAWQTWQCLFGNTEEGRKAAFLRFKLFFPSRVAYGLAGCLYLIPAAFPAYFSGVSTRFLELGGGAVKLYVTLDPPLIVAFVLAVLTVVGLFLDFKYARGSVFDMFASDLSKANSNEETENSENS